MERTSLAATAAATPVVIPAVLHVAMYRDGEFSHVADLTNPQIEFCKAVARRRGNAVAVAIPPERCVVVRDRTGHEVGRFSYKDPHIAVCREMNSLVALPGQHCTVEYAVVSLDDWKHEEQ